MNALPTMRMARGLAVLDRGARLVEPLPLLLTLSLVQAMLWLWATFGIPDQRIPPGHALTLLGAGLYQPDHDLPIYLLGALLCVLMDAAVVTLLARAQRRGDGAPGTRVELLACLAIGLFRFVGPDSGPAWLIAAVAGLNIVAWRLRVRWRTPASRRAATGPGPAPTAQPAAPPTKLFRACLVPMAILALFVFVPWPQALLWRTYDTDWFHHFDFYVMAPALAHAHGLRLGSDFYAQYGVGWPLVMDGLGRATGLRSYTGFLRLEVLVGCAYFLGLFLFLRAWLRSARWATAGLLLALALALFTNSGDGPKWLWPSSTVMRYAYDVALFAVLLRHARRGDARLGPLAGTVLALQALFSTDVGLYLSFAFAVYLVCAACRPAQDRPAGSLGRFALGAALALVLVGGAGFTLANQGRLPDRAFWTGLTESIFAYGGGIANLPIAQAIGSHPGFDLLLLAMLVLYLRSVGAALSACVARRVSAQQALRAVIAVYGLGTLLIFIGRSHPQNLMHVTIPFCLLLTEKALSTARLAGLEKANSRLGLPHLVAAGLLAAIFVLAEDNGYPNVLDVALRAATTTRSRATWTDSTGDAIPTESAPRVAEFRAASDAIRRASAGGRHSVAVIGYNDTAYLLEADVAPYFRYSPVLANLLFKEQVDGIARRIATAPPDWIFIATGREHTLYGATSVDALKPILAAIVPRYTPAGSAGHFTVYRKTSP